MKVLYILPNEAVKTGGNWITVTRIAKGLKKIGITVDIIEVRDAKEELLKKYDIIHAFHIFKTLGKIKDLLKKMQKIVIASFTGTDFKQFQKIKEGKKEILDSLNKIDAIIVFHDDAKGELIEEGIIPERVEVIPQSTMPIETNLSIERKQFIKGLFSPECINFIFVGGIRKVKGPLNLVRMMSSLVKKVENIKLIIIGTILEEELAEKLKSEIKYKPWVEYFGEVSHEEAKHFILSSDIVVNNSISEGMPNTLLEGQQLGKAILAKDNSGNRSIVNHGINGFLFKNKYEFEHYARKLIQNSKLRDSMGLSGRQSRKNYTWNQEISKYEKVYRDLYNLNSQ